MKRTAVAIVFFGLIILAGYFGIDRRPVPAQRLRVYGKVPDFSFVDELGRTYGLSDLRNTVWVANFFFTHCPAQCPMVMQRLKTLHKTLAERGIKFVSFTIDPARDTCRRLKHYAQENSLPQQNWRLLTGEKSHLDSLAVNGFHLGTGAASLVHSFKVVLVDASGKIRGYYDGLEDSAFKTLQHDALVTLGERAGSGTALGE